MSMKVKKREDTNPAFWLSWKYNIHAGCYRAILKRERKKIQGGGGDKKQRNDYYQNGKCYSQFTSAVFNYFSPNHKRTIKIKVLAATSLCSFVSSHRLVIISFSGREILGRWWGRTGVPGPGRPRFLLESRSFPWSKAKVLTKKEHL